MFSKAIFIIYQKNLFGDRVPLIQMLFDLDPPVPCEGPQWDCFHVYQQFIFVKTPLNAKNEDLTVSIGSE